MLSIIEKVLYLQNVELFRGIPTEDLAEIARVADDRSFGRGDVLIRDGEVGDELYLVVDGVVDIVGAGDRRLASLEPKSVIGEMAILSDAPTSARASRRQTGERCESGASRSCASYGITRRSRSG